MRDTNGNGGGDGRVVSDPQDQHLRLPIRLRPENNVGSGEVQTAVIHIALSWGNQRIVRIVLSICASLSPESEDEVD